MACAQTGMYKIKPIFDLDEIKVNSPMYAMKNIQSFKTEKFAHDNEEKTQDPRLDQVEAKQQVLFRLIDEINNVLSSLKKELTDGPKIEPKAKSSPQSKNRMSSGQPNFSNLGVIHEVVLNASVKNPPNSILVLNHLWNDLTIQFSWHLHSSVKGIPKNLKKFENINGMTGTSEPHLRVRVVWKEVWSDCELVVSPMNSVPLLGEVNFLRFLQRGVNPQEESDPEAAAYSETKLDACHCLRNSENLQQFQEYYNILSDGLDKNKWLLGNNLSIVDLACWSVISNLKNPNLNPLLTRWYKDFNSLVGSK